MEASPTPRSGQQDLRAALRVLSESDDYSPAGLALEAARAIDAAYPECMGAFSFLAQELICHEGGSAPSFFTVLEDLGYVATERAAVQAGLLD
jgi:hypothetical protein